MIKGLQLQHQCVILLFLLGVFDGLFGIEALALILHLALAEVGELPVLGLTLLSLFVHHGADVCLELRVGTLDGLLNLRLHDGVDLGPHFLRGFFPFGILGSPDLLL